MRKLHALTIIVALLLIFPAIYGCKSKTETQTKTIETEKGTMTVKSSEDKTDITITTKEGKTIEMKRTAGKLPDNWPAELSVIEGGKLVFSQRLTEGNKVADQVHITTSASVEETMNYYQDKLKNGGWKIEGTVTMPQMSMINASKDDLRAMLQFMTDSGETKAIIIVSNEG
jgi:hypothetical protein